MLASGQRDRLITFQRATITRSTLGQETESWATTLGTAWASVLYGKGSERREAAAQGASNTATFRTLYNPTLAAVTEKDRIVFNGNWNITSIALIGRSEIEFTAVIRKG